MIKELAEEFLGQFTCLGENTIKNNLTAGIHKIKWKYRHDRKCETHVIKSECFLAYTSIKDDLIEEKCLYCNNNYQKKFDEILRKSFLNTYIFSIHDIIKFILF